MADIKLQVGPSEDTVTQLRSAGTAMQSAMEEAQSILNNASNELSGSLQTDSTALYQTLHNYNQSMAGDVTSAAAALEQMISLIQNADQRGAANFGA
jgi:hypothetical protein